MDDPNSALPSDPTVDESYTRGSRPVQPRTRSGSRTSGNDKDPQKSATKRKKTAGSKTRTSASSSVSTKERPARARTTTSRSANADDNGSDNRAEGSSRKGGATPGCRDDGDEDTDAAQDRHGHKASDEGGEFLILSG